MSLTLLGYLAAFLTTLSFLPQVLRTWRSGSARDLSLSMLLLFLAGLLLWLAYGVIRADPPLIAANGVTAGLVASLLGFKLREMARERRAPQGLAK